MGELDPLCQRYRYDAASGPPAGTFLVNGMSSSGMLLTDRRL
jgi:hypothetical protein